MRWPIRNQIMFPLMGVAIASLTAVGAIYALLAERRTCEHVEQQLRQVIGVLSTSTFPLTDAVLRQMRDLSNAEFVLRDDGDSTIASTLPDAGPLPLDSAVTRLEDVSLGPSVAVGDRWYFHTPVKLPRQLTDAPSGMLHVLFPQDEYRRAWRHAFLPSFVVGAATLVVLGIVAQLLANRMGRATARLSDEVLRIARGDFRAVTLPPIDDEFRDLSAAVNQTAQMLADYEQQVRRSEQMRTVNMLGASIAHQIRNSATGCRLALDLHRGDCHADGDTLDVAQQQLRLMESQLQRFLRIGKRPVDVVNKQVDLSQLVENLIPLIRPAAQHSGVQLGVQSNSGHLAVKADEEALSQVIINLLLNAVEAAQKNHVNVQDQAHVNVNIAETADHAAEIVISDSGAGPAGSVAALLFEPFVTDKPEGAGLGLAVAKEVVTAHGGTIDWHRENGTTRFRIVLPLMNGHTSVTNTHS